MKDVIYSAVLVSTSPVLKLHFCRCPHTLTSISNPRGLSCAPLQFLCPKYSTVQLTCASYSTALEAVNFDSAPDCTNPMMIQEEAAPALDEAVGTVFGSYSQVAAAAALDESVETVSVWGSQVAAAAAAALGVFVESASAC